MPGSGFLGGLTYGHWLEEDLALTITVGAMALEAETRVTVSGTSAHAAAVGSFLLGLRHYFSSSTGRSPVRPYLGGGVGIYRGSQDDVISGTTVLATSRQETAFGGRLAVGSDFLLSRHFLTGLAAGYNLMTDFEAPIGGSRNYGGPEMSLDLSYLFGSGAADE